MKKNYVRELAMRARNRLVKDSQIINVEEMMKKEERAFEEKVRGLLEEDADILNPIKRLMDEDMMMRMDARGRERYMLETIEKYLKVKSKIEAEMTSLLCE